MPSRKFADNYRQLVALRNVMEHASAGAASGLAPLRELSALLLVKRMSASGDTEESHVE